jgi:protein SCO1/2
VRLGQFFGGKKAVLLSLVYYRCPGLCTMTLNGMAAAFKPLKFTAARNSTSSPSASTPKDTPQLGAEKKGQYLKRYGRAGAGRAGTSDRSRSRSAPGAVGRLPLRLPPQTDQYTHAAGIMLLTPGGKARPLFYGLEYSSRDLRLAMVEASERKDRHPGRRGLAAVLPVRPDDREVRRRHHDAHPRWGAC